MSQVTRPTFVQRFRYAQMVWKAFRAERRYAFDDALRHLEKAAAVFPLDAAERVYRANLLLQARRLDEAHPAFAILRKELEGAEDADRQYLRHFCTHQLAHLTNSPQWKYEARQGNLIDCRAYLKRRFPMVTI